eukprot:233370-Karenia_brevis.AAC.1
MCIRDRLSTPSWALAPLGMAPEVRLTDVITLSSQYWNQRRHGAVVQLNKLIWQLPPGRIIFPSCLT